MIFLTSAYPIFIDFEQISNSRISLSILDDSTGQILIYELELIEPELRDNVLFEHLIATVPIVLVMLVIFTLKKLRNSKYSCSKEPSSHTYPKFNED